MKTHKCATRCPRCAGPLAKTTEWGWIDDDTCTAIICCPVCRTDTGWGEAAVVGCHAPTEAEALRGVSVRALVAQMRDWASEMID